MDLIANRSVINADKPFPTRWFLGVPFTPMTLPEAASRIVARDPRAPFCYVTTPNAQHVVNVRRGNALFIDGQNDGWMVLNDSKICRCWQTDCSVTRWRSPPAAT